MQKWKVFASLLLVMTALAAATLACDLGNAVYGMTTPMPVAVLAATIASFPPPSLSNLGAAYSSNPDQLATLYASGVIPATPFAQLFGDMDQVESIKALKSAIPDLKVNTRMSIVQSDWMAWSFDLSGTFTQPLVTANGTLPPTHQPWFTTVQMLVHLTQDGQIDQEYSAVDMVAVLHETGVAGFEHVQVGAHALEKPMTEITPSTDPAASAAAATLMDAVGNGPFLIWLPSGVQQDYYTTDVTYHSPYGDFSNDASEVEDNLLQLASEPLEVPMIIRQGNLIGMAFTYRGSLDYPVEFADGTTLPANHQPVQFSGVVLGQVDVEGNGEAWVMYNRLDNPITTDNFPVPGATEQATLPAPEATLTPVAEQATLPTPEATLTPTATATTANATASCTLSASQTVNLRAGAGTNFALGGSLAAGQSAEADGQAQANDGQTWYHLPSQNLWVRSDVVTGNCGTLPQIAS